MTDGERHAPGVKQEFFFVEVIPVLFIAFIWYLSTKTTCCLAFQEFIYSLSFLTSLEKPMSWGCCSFQPL
jgi:hypothetical protein